MPEFLRLSTVLILFITSSLVLNAQKQDDTLSSEKSRVLSLDVDFHLKKREALRELLPDRSVALFFSSPEKVKSNDVYYPFHQDPNFYYLTGLREADALLIVFKEPFEFGGESIRELIFVAGRSKTFETWHGVRLGTAGVMSDLNFEKAMLNSEFADIQMDFSYFDYIFYNLPDGAFFDDVQNRGDIASMLKHFHLKTDSLEKRKNSVKLNSLLYSMREIKSDEEIELIQEAVNITCKAQRTLMQNIDSTYTEYKAEAMIEFVFRSEGAKGPAFPSILGGGENSCTLHYITNNGDLQNGDLLVVDIGAEYESYASDITRTIPISGKFSEEQAEIYNIVLKAQEAGIEECKPGVKFWEPGEAAVREIQKGLLKLGIIKRAYQYKKYFMHGTSHYLGLDVHDLGSYEPLKAGNVITVEPGIYIPEGSPCDEKWWNIGIRIEDDVLISNDTPEVLSECVPKKLLEIEAIMEKK